jgi:hypothetical protein
MKQRVLGVVVSIGVFLALAGGVSASSATSIEVSIAPATLDCNGGAAFVFVTSRDSAGAFAPGGPTHLTTSAGMITPADVTDTTGTFAAILTAPSNFHGTATVTVTNEDGLTAVATALISCMPQTRDSCKHGGWQSLTDAEGNEFKNQGACVKFANENGRP